MDFKESTFMYAIALAVVVFVTLQSVFFIVKSWKHAKELGIEKEKLKGKVEYYEIPSVKLDRSKIFSNFKIPFVLV